MKNIKIKFFEILAKYKQTYKMKYVLGKITVISEFRIRAI
jgi:hypothetical protein